MKPYDPAKGVSGVTWQDVEVCGSSPWKDAAALQGGKARGTAVESVGGSVLPTDAQVEMPSGQWTQELRSGKRSAWGCEVWGW